MSNTSVTADKGGSKSESLDRPNEMYSFENNALLKSQSLPSDLKVRKPYTITKQREKWTEEEHHRFLEALKLYGRGWRQIEEHVGTKTAVQIRSHAQKFFSKVARESNGSPESFIKPVEIPPPRPKRKPMHPYPRKSVDSLKVTPVSNQLEGFPSSDTLVLDKDKQSPTSVLSALASETLGSAVSDQQNGCSSPASCTTEMQSANLLPVEKENEYATSNSSPQEGKVPLLSAGLNLEDALSTKIEPESKDSECTKGDAMTVPRCKSIRLLGKTILVTGSRKPHPPGAENYKSAISSSSRVIDNVNFVRTLPSKQLETSLVMITTNWNHPFPSGSPCLELQKDYINTAEANPPNECLPSWPLHQGPSLINFLSYNQNSAPTPRESIVQEGLKEKEVPNERSFTGSSTGSVSELDNREKNSDAPVESQYRQPSSSIQPSLSKPAKGFVPYKRCLPEGDIKSPIIESEERERQRSRVCS